MPSELSKNDIFILTICASAIFASITLMTLGIFGCANTIEDDISGIGNLYVRHDSKEASDLLSIINSSVVYNMNRIWDENSNVFSTGVIVSGAKSSDGFRNQYLVTASGAGYKHEYKATAISGEFSGSGEVKVYRGDTPETLDSLFLMDSRKGNATFQGRIKSSNNGRPITEEELDAIGQFTIRSYLNVSESIDTVNGWLDFCATLDHLIDPKNAKDVYIAPDGYTLDDTGNLKKDT